MNFNKTFYAVTCFYSRIIIRKLNDSSLTIFRKIEKLIKLSAKINADIKFLKLIILKLIAMSA